MRRFKNYFIFISVLVLSTIIFSDFAYSWWGEKPAKGVKQKRRVLRRSGYIRGHDLNADGKVDIKDKLILLKNKKGAYNRMKVSSSNADLIVAMDYNADGIVEAAEMKRFFSQYDINSNGFLEDREINAATK